MVRIKRSPFQVPSRASLRSWPLIRTLWRRYYRRILVSYLIHVHYKRQQVYGVFRLSYYAFRVFMEAIIFCDVIYTILWLLSLLQGLSHITITLCLQLPQCLNFDRFMPFCALLFEHHSYFAKYFLAFSQ